MIPWIRHRGAAREFRRGPRRRAQEQGSRQSPRPPCISPRRSTPSRRQTRSDGARRGQPARQIVAAWATTR